MGEETIEASRYHMGLLSEIRKLKDAVEHTNNFCLCKRNDFGFDYHEKHSHMGKPKGGSRWKTPKDYIRDNKTLEINSQRNK